jgi:hypothetical protein
MATPVLRRASCWRSRRLAQNIVAPGLVLEGVGEKERVLRMPTTLLQLAQSPGRSWNRGAPGASQIGLDPGKRRCWQMGRDVGQSGQGQASSDAFVGCVRGQLVAIDRTLGVAHVFAYTTELDQVLGRKAGATRPAEHPLCGVRTIGEQEPTRLAQGRVCLRLSRHKSRA